jgi:hypothetical protein
MSVPRPDFLPLSRVSRRAGLIACWTALAVGCSDAQDLLDGATSGDDAFSRIYASSDFQTCSGCHAPGASGKTEGTETTQDWSTRDKAYASLQRNAAGMIGNFKGCNGVPFIAPSSERSLLVAAFDFDVRTDFQSSTVSSCDGDAIADQTLKIGGPLPASLLTQLKDWIDAGAPDK